MATDLMGLIGGVLDNGVVEQIGKVVGESPARTQAAVSGAVPSMLAGVLNHATSSPSGAGQLLSMLSTGGFERVTGNLGGILGGGQGPVDQLVGSGRQILGSLFGNRLGGVTNAVSSSAGVSQGTGSSILAMVAPVVMGMLGKQVASGGLNASGLLGLLRSNKDAIAKSAPAGLASALGLGSIGDLGTRAGALVEEGARSATRNWGALLAAAAALLLVILGIRAFSTRTETPQATGGSGPARALTSVALPGGGKLSVEQDTFLYNLAGYLGNASDSNVPKTFVFDNLNFESNGTTLTPASRSTVTDLTQVLKAYPSSRVKLVGYTDSTGDPAANKSLSLARAKTVSDLLSNGGVAAIRIDTDGMGDANPVASNDTEAGRAKNRRLELVVTQK
jgi:outer membrane protein OmpA-like peptidoglycan-associated protein